MIAKYLIQLRQSKLCRKGCCQPPYDVTPLETAMPLGVKGRRSYPLLRLGSYKPMTFRSWVVDKEGFKNTEIARVIGVCAKTVAKYIKMFNDSLSHPQKQQKQQRERQINKIKTIFKFPLIIQQCQ